MSKAAGDKAGGEVKRSRAELKSENELLELHRIFLTDIECTFLMAFCQSQYCTESLLFIVAVESFRDIYGAKRLERWKSWQTLDKEYKTGKLDKIDFHKKYNVSIEQVRLAAENIWQMFFDKAAKFEICCSTALTNNIQRRMSQIHVYGPETFSEALVDPLKTLHRDTWPRYKVSSIFEEMEHTMEMLAKETTQDDLQIPKPIFPVHLLPSSVAPHDGSNTPMGVCQILENYLKDPMLYEEFLAYLRGIYAAEDLLFIRSAEMFEEMTQYAIGNKRISPEASALAWQTYRYFLMESSVYKISVEKKTLHNICINMFNPSSAQFSVVKDSCWKATREFEDLVHHYSNREETIFSKACIIC